MPVFSGTHENAVPGVKSYYIYYFLTLESLIILIALCCLSVVFLLSL